MSKTDRLYCTHCTFGTSALESHSADNADKVLGYSVRASSVDDADRGRLRQLFRAVERLLSYELPRDTPAGKKESLDAATAPRRLTFLPNLGDSQIVGQISYRARDTAGRPGSYFADIVVGEAGRPGAGRAGQRSQATERRWSPTECLRLWSADYEGKPQGEWWCDSEERLKEQTEEGRGVPVAPSSELAEVRSGGAEYVGDATFWSFLNTPPGGDFDDRGRIIPPRWRDMPVEDRRSLVANLLQATINLLKNRGRGNVVVAVEPSVAALLFFGVCRLLPESLTIYSDQATGISFSTYEPFPERPMTNLLATTFFDIENPSNDLPAEVYQRGFACNTFRHPFKCLKDGRELPRNDSYVQHILQLATDGHAPARDHADEHELLLTLSGLSNLNVAMLDQLVELDRSLAEYTRGVRPWAEVSRTSKPPSAVAEAEFLRKRFRTMLEAGARQGQGEWPPDLLQRAVEWLGDELVAEDGLWSGGHPESYRVLVGMLPTNEAALKDFLSSKSVTQPPDQVVVEAVVSVAHRGHKLPDCLGDFLTEREKAGRTKGTPTFLQTIIARLDENQLSDILLNSNPDVHADRVLSAITGEGSTLPKALVAALSEKLLVKVLDDGVATATRWRLLAEHSSVIKPLKLLDRPIKPELQDRLDRLFRGSSPQSGLRNQPPAVIGSDAFRHLQEWAELTELRSDNVSLLTSWQHFYKSFNPLKEELANGRPKAFGRRKPQLNRDNVEAVASALLRIRGLSSEPLSEPATKQCLSVFRAAIESREAGVPSDMRPQLEDVMQRHFVDALASQSKTERTIRESSQSGGRRRGTLVRVILLVVPTVFVLACVVGVGMVVGSRYKVPKKPSGKSPPSVSQPQENASQTRPEVPERGSQQADPVKPAVAPAVTQKAIGLTVDLARGKWVVKWNKAVSQHGKCSLELTVPDDIPGEPKFHPCKLDSDTSGTQEVQLDRDSFGEYCFRFAVTMPDGKVVRSEQTIAFVAPEPPVIRDIALSIDPGSGEPSLAVTVDRPPTDIEVRYGDLRFKLTAVEKSSRKQLSPGGGVPAVTVSKPATEGPSTLDLRFPLSSLQPDILLKPDSVNFTVFIDTACAAGRKSQARPASFKAQANVDAFMSRQLDKTKKMNIRGVCSLRSEKQANPNNAIHLLDVHPSLRGSEVDLVLMAPTATVFGQFKLTRVRPAPPEPDLGCWQFEKTTATENKPGDTGGSDSPPSVVCGKFEIVAVKPWKCTLQFNPEDSDPAREAITRLSYCKLGVVHHPQGGKRRMVASLQLCEPMSGGDKFALKFEKGKSVANPVDIPKLQYAPAHRFQPPADSSHEGITAGFERNSPKPALCLYAESDSSPRKQFAKGSVEIDLSKGKFIVRPFDWFNSKSTEFSNFPLSPDNDLLGVELPDEVPYQVIIKELKSAKASRVKDSALRDHCFKELTRGWTAQPMKLADLEKIVRDEVQAAKGMSDDYQNYVESCLERIEQLSARYKELQSYAKQAQKAHFSFTSWSIYWDVVAPPDVEKQDKDYEAVGGLRVRAIVCDAEEPAESKPAATAPTTELNAK